MNKRFNDSDNRKSLPELLEQFRKALEAEIEAIKRQASNSAVPLSNGKRIGENASQYQYVFNIDSVLNAPEGSPVELKVPGKLSIEAAIVSVEELRVTLSSNIDLGDFILFASLQTDLSILLKKLIERIENNSEVDNEVGMRMLGKATVEGTPAKIDYDPNEELNSAQKSAVESAVGRNLTFIWGPPGTGKTRVIGKIINELYKRNRTVLLVSHTNTAVDQAISISAKTVDKQELVKGCILRLGVPKNPQLIKNYPEVLLETQQSIRAKDLNSQLENKMRQQRDLKTDIKKVHQQIVEFNWCCAYESERVELSLAILSYERDCRLNGNLQERIDELQIQKEKLSPNVAAIKDCIRLKARYDEYIEARNKVVSKKHSASDELIRLNAVLEQCKIQMVECQRRTEIQRELSKGLSLSAQKLILERFENEIDIIQSQISTKLSEVQIRKNLLSESSRVNAIIRAIRRLPSPERLSQEINVLDLELGNLSKQLNAKIVEYGKKESAYQKTLSLQKKVQLITISIDDVEGRTKNIFEKIRKCNKTIESSKEKFVKLDELIVEIEIKINAIRAEYGGRLEATISEYISIDSELNECSKNKISLEKSVYIQKQNIVQRIKKIGNASIEKIFNGSTDYNILLDTLDYSYNLLFKKLQVFSVSKAQEEIDILEDCVKMLIAEVEEIKNKLAEIEKQIVAESQIIGTTLTKAYLSDELQARKFDTVILDEASMAPIPALWASTLMSSNNVVIVGDFKQLPPIVLSDNEVAKEWIGRDIFEHSGMKERYDNKCHPDYFIILNQ